MVVKDFLHHKNPDVIMFEATKRKVCDRRFVSGVWMARNKD